MRLFNKFGIAAAVLVVAIFVYQMVAFNHQAAQVPAIAQPSSDTSVVIQDSSDEKSVAAVPEALDNTSTINEVIETSLSLPDQVNASYPPLAAYDIGNGPISDEDLSVLVNRLNNDPALMADLINELRSEADPQRLKNLIFILGRTENSAVLPAAEEMIYSGIDSSRKAGLDLLSRVASKNPEAYTLASDLLISETEPAVLIGALNVLAHPDAASPETRNELVAQVATLAENNSATVRGFSIKMLVELSSNPDLSPILHDALYDSSSSVRTSAVKAFSKFPHHSVEITERLLELSENELEPFNVRRGAYLALSSNSPDEALKARLEEIELSMRK